MPDLLKAQLIIMAVGSFIVIPSYHYQYRATAISILLASTLVYLGVCAPVALQFLRHVFQGVPFDPRLNFFWSFAAYWFGLKWCDRNLPRFSNNWGQTMNRSLFAFGVYVSLAACFAYSKFLFVLLIVPSAVFSVFFPFGAFWPRRSHWQHRHFENGLYWLE